MKPRVIPGNRTMAVGMPLRSVRLERQCVHVNPKPFPLKPAQTAQAEQAVPKDNAAIKRFE